MKKTQVLILLVALVLGFSSCATTISSKKLRDISLGMTKGEVKGNIGEPTVSRGAIINKYNQAVEVWEYTLALPTHDSPGEIIGKSTLTLITFGMGAATFKGERKNYWLYFLEDKLVQWREAGDWTKETERVYEFNFNPTPVLTK